MLRIALPLALAELGWMAMGVVDTIMVGRLPDSAVAIGATSIGNATFYGLGIFGLGLLSGLDSTVSRSFGANDMPSARRGIASGLALSVLVTPLLMAGIYGITALLGVIGVEPSVRQQAVQFARVLVWCLPPLMLYSVFRRYLQGIHHVRPIAMSLVSANLVNILGNWILIYGHWGAPGMGIRGSALSTVLARIYLAGALFLAVKRRDPAAFTGLRLIPAEVWNAFRLGLPAALTILFEVGVFNAASVLAGRLDPASIAANAIAMNAVSVTYMVPLGIGAAAAVSVGKAIGAGDKPGAAHSGWTAIGLGVAFAVCATFAFLLFPRQIAMIFTLDPRVIAVTVTLLGIAAVFQLSDGLQTVAAGALRGAADTKTAMVWNLLGYWAFGLPLGYWLCFGLKWGVAGLWDGLCLALIVISVGVVGAWARQYRKHGQHII
jgi:MATE family multidrug resistance protein